MIRTVVTSITPTFLLRRVDPNKVIDDYLSGKYSQVVAITPNSPSPSTPTITSQAPLGATVAPTSDAPLYGYRNKSNTTQVIATTSCDIYLQWINQETNEPIVGGRCHHCHRTFNHQALGIPLRLTMNKDGKCIVHFTGIACRYGCLLAYWRRKHGGSSRYRDFRFMDGEQLIRHLYALQYPQAGPLVEAKDPDLLKCNGGCLSDAEYDSDNYVYLPSPMFIWAPAKMQYLRY